MRISELQEQRAAGTKAVSARVEWENCDRPSMEVVYRVGEKDSDALACNPHAFLVACAVPAMLRGEQRIQIEGEIHPELIHGLGVTFRTLRHWYPELFPAAPPRIEAVIKTVKLSTAGSQAGMFFSGGLDSLTTLRSNRLALPMEHPNSVREGVFLRGLQPEVDANFHQVQQSLDAIAADAGLRLLPVETNVRYLEDNWTFWEMQWEAGVFSSVAHALQPRFSRMTLGSTFYIQELTALGSHPLIDRWYGTTDMVINHDDVTLSRLDKVRLIAEWEAGLQNLRVCNNPPIGRLNCGRCEKCVRTMLGLLAAGALGRATTFPYRDVTVDMLRAIGPIHGTHAGFYPELLAPLREQGRDDLASVLESKLRGFVWKERLKHLDKSLLGGGVASVRHLARTS